MAEGHRKQKNRLGAKLTIEARKKISVAHKGQKAWNKGLKLPQFSGVNSPNWRGGVTSSVKARTETPEWYKIRNRVY